MACRDISIAIALTVTLTAGATAQISQPANNDAGRERAACDVRFFQETPAPAASFDARTNTWTFGNARIECKVSHSGDGFQVLSLKDKRTNIEAIGRPSTAGRFVFTPAWQTVLDSCSKDLPKAGESYSPRFYSYAFPANARFVRLLCAREVRKGTPGEIGIQKVVVRGKGQEEIEAIPVPAGRFSTRGLDGVSNIWFTSSTIDLGRERSIIEVRIQYRADKNNKFSDVPASLTLQAATHEAHVVDLGRDFAVGKWSLTDSAAVKGGGVKTLEIEALGTNANAGLNVSICYDIYPGDEPWVTKWFRFSSSKLDTADAPLVLDTVVFDDLVTGAGLDTAKNKTFGFTNLNMIPAKADGANGLMVSNLNYMADIVAKPNEIRLAYHPNAGLKEYMQATGHRTTKAFEGFWDGGSWEAGEFQYQVFLIDRHISTTATTTKPVVCLWPTCGDQGSDATAKVATAMGFAGLEPTESSSAWRGRYAARDMHVAAYDIDNPKSYAATAVRYGLGPVLNICDGSFFRRTGVNLSDMAGAQSIGRYLADLCTRCKAAAFDFEDHPGKQYLLLSGTHNRGNHGYADAMWREGVRTLTQEVKAAAAPRPFSIGRTWVSLLEVFDVADWTQEDDYDNYGWADGWFGVYMAKIPLQPNFVTDIPSPAFVVNRPELPCRSGKAARDAADLDYTASRQANMGIMWAFTGGRSMTLVTPEEIAVQKKWTSWHNENAQLLEYTQQLEVSDRMPKNVFGFMHLRNRCAGKYGFVCWWNQSGSPVQVAPKIDLKKWMLQMDLNRLKVKSARTGNPVAFSVQDGAIQLEPVKTPLWSYEVLELSARTADDPNGR